MTGFLGYDPGRLAALRRAVAQALAEAARVRCDDPLATAPLAAWRRAVSLVEPWDARLGSILSCSFDTPYQPVAHGLGLPIDDIRPLNPAWTVVTDPIAGLPAAVDPLERLDELLALLLGLDPALLGDLATAQRLVELLDATFADDTARRRFFTLLGADGLAALAAGLARWTAAGERDQVALGASAVLDRLARGLGTSVQRGEVDEATYRYAALDGRFADPLTAALLVRGAGFPSSVTSTWTLDILDRARALDPAGLDTLAGPDALSTGGVLLEALTSDPDAGRQVLGALGELDVLLGPHLDGDARGRFLLAVTDRTRYPVPETTALLQHVLGYLDGHRNVATSMVSTRDLHDWLGVSLTPFITELVPSPSVPVAGWSGTDAVRILSWVSESPLSAAALLAAVQLHADQVVPAAIGASGAAGGSSLARASAAMEQLGVLTAAVEQGQVAWARAAHATYATSQMVVGLLLDRAVKTLALVLCPPAALAADAFALASPWVLGAAFDELAEHGVVQVPPTGQEMAAEMTLRSGDLTVGALATGVRTAFDRLVARGVLPATSPPPQPGPCEQEASYRDDLTAWAASLGPAAARLSQTADAAAVGFLLGRATVPGPAPLGPFDRFDQQGRIQLGRNAARTTDKVLTTWAPIDF